MTKSKTRSFDHLAAARSTAHASVRRKGETTRQAVYHELRISDQPLVASEVHALLAKRGLLFDTTYIRTILQGFVTDGSASTRLETGDERLIRNGGRATRGRHQTAMYYWAPAGKVPYRTKMTTVPTVTKSKKKTRPAPKRVVQTGHVSRPTVPTLLQRIATLEEKVARLESILG